MSFTAVCLDHAAAAAAAAAGATVLRPDPLAQPDLDAFPLPYAVFSSTPFEQSTMHYGWFTQCLLIPGGTGSDHKGARARNIKVPIEVGDVATIMAEFASGAELRDNLRELKQVKTKLASVDDIVAMTLHERVRETLKLKTVQWEPTATAAKVALLDMREVASSPDLVVQVDSVRRGQAISAASSHPLTVRLVQPDDIAWSDEELADLWNRIEKIGDASVLYLPFSASDDQVRRLVNLSLMRKQDGRSRAAAAAADLKPLLQQIEEASRVLDVQAGQLKY